MQLSSDVLEFIQLLNQEKVEYLIIGGWALAFHAQPRYTKDIDLFIANDPSNAAKIVTVLKNFGFGSLDISEKDFLEKGQIIQLGVEPNRIDILTSVSGVDFSKEWPKREQFEHQGVILNVISKEGLVQNKKSVGRPQDLVDIGVIQKRSGVTK